MDIPIELFLGGMGISIALAIFGFLRQPQIPAMLCFGGMFVLVFAVATDNILMDWFSNGMSENIYAYNVESRSGTVTVNSASNIAVAEFASSSSSLLVGKEINCIDMFLAITGAPTGTATIGTLGGTGLIITTFGTMDVSTLTTSSQWKTFCLPAGQTYIIQNQDRLGLRYTGGDAVNSLIINVDANNPFDGTVTFRQGYVAAWASSTAQDHTQRMYILGTGLSTISADYPFTELPKTLFALMGSIFMLCGALMVLRNN